MFFHEWLEIFNPIVAFNYIMLYEVYLQNRWSIRRLRRNPFSADHQSQYSKKIISVVSFTILWFVVLKLVHVVLKLVFVFFIWARDIAFRPLAGVWLSAIACQHITATFTSAIFRAKLRDIVKRCSKDYKVGRHAICTLLIFARKIALVNVALGVGKRRRTAIRGRVDKMAPFYDP